jgi:HD-GYP domain-containing protein (c-di-GMP phosphodiesterase class II)
MTTHRPYRRALPSALALAELERCAGTQFDPALTRLFVEVWDATVRTAV